MRDISELLEHEAVLSNSLRYWVEHWDWECQTLSGSDKEEFQSILDDWPDGLRIKDENTLLVLHGSLRELLYGASSIREEEFRNVLGVEISVARKFFDLLGHEFKENEV